MEKEWKWKAITQAHFIVTYLSYLPTLHLHLYLLLPLLSFPGYSMHAWNCLSGELSPQTINICWVITVCRATEFHQWCGFCICTKVPEWSQRIYSDLCNYLFPNNKRVDPSVILKTSECFSCFLSYLIGKHHRRMQNHWCLCLAGDKMKPRGSVNLVRCT